MNNIGDKLKHFRKRSGLSQFELETEIGASPGSISRIESGSVNPTKETLEKLSTVLKLTQREKIYLTTDFEKEPSDDDIKRVLDEVNIVLDDPGSLSYLLDNRSRVVKFGKGLYKFAEEIGINLDLGIGKNVLEILFDDSIGINKAFDDKNIYKHALHVLGVVKQEKGFLLNDPWWKDLLSKTLEHPIAREAWEELEKQNIDIISSEARTINFTVNGNSVPMVYNYTLIYSDPRFMLLEFK